MAKELKVGACGDFIKWLMLPVAILFPFVIIISVIIILVIIFILLRKSKK